MKLRPVLFRWREVDVCLEGGEVRRAKVMVPHNRFAPLCARQFAVDEDYALGPADNEVSERSRKHFFAALGDSWNSLPLEVAKRYPTPEHFRKWVLVQVNHCTVVESAFETVADAKAHAIGLRRVDEYAVIGRVGSTVVCKIAKSIARSAIKGPEFQRVKNEALDFAASMIGVSRQSLEANAGTAA